MVLDEPAAVVDGEPDERTGLRRLYVALTRAVSGLTVVHAPRCRRHWPGDAGAPRPAGEGVGPRHRFERRVQRVPPGAHRRGVDRRGPAAGPDRAADVEGVEPAARSTGRCSARRPPPTRIRGARSRGSPSAASASSTGRPSSTPGAEPAVRKVSSPGRPASRARSGVAVGGPVDRPVEGPAAAVDHPGQRPHRARGRRRRPRRGSRARTPRRPRPAAPRRWRTARRARGPPVAKPSRDPQHHPQRQVDGRPHRGEGLHGTG